MRLIDADETKKNIEQAFLQHHLGTFTIGDVCDCIDKAPTIDDEDAIESFNNAWRALCKQYNDYPEEHVQIALNMLSKIIDKVETRFNNKKKKEGQISIEEWINWFKENSK